MPNQGVPVIFKNKVAYGYAEQSVKAYDVSVSDYNALTEQQQLDGSIRFTQGVDAVPNGNNVWAKLGTTPLAEGLPRDCSQAVNELKSNLTDKGDWVLLKTLTTANTEYTLDYDISNFKTVVAVSIYSGFILNTIEYPANDLVGKYLVVCFNDGTVRKGQFEVLSTTKVKTSGGGGSTGWQNITEIQLYGIK